MNIAIYGSTSERSPDIIQKCYALGEKLGKRGDTIITGGCPGYPYDVAFAARAQGSLCIAHSPARNMEEHLKMGMPREIFTHFVYVPDLFEGSLAAFKYRNITSAMAADAAIIIGGRIGTLNEFTNAYDLGKRIGVLEGSGGITTRVLCHLVEDAAKERGLPVLFEHDPCVLRSLHNSINHLQTSEESVK